jgi:hypothetical protein
MDQLVIEGHPAEFIQKEGIYIVKLIGQKLFFFFQKGQILGQAPGTEGELRPQGPFKKRYFAGLSRHAQKLPASLLIGWKAVQLKKYFKKLKKSDLKARNRS